MTRSVTIPESELGFRYVRSGGPGGQHANKTSTKVELTWDASTSSAIGPRQRARLFENLGRRIDADGSIRVRSDKHRSQLRNKEDAVERLCALIERGLEVKKDRVPTGPTSGSKQKRLDVKKRRAQVKQGRRRPAYDD